MAMNNKQGAGCLGGGVGLLFLAIRLIFAVVVGVADSNHNSTSSYDYHSYDYTPTPVYVDPPTLPPNWNDNFRNDPLQDEDRFPWLRQDPGFVIPPGFDDPVTPPAVEEPTPTPVVPGDAVPSPSGDN